MLSKEEWRKTAELAAAAEDGRRHASWLRFKRFGAVPTGILVGAGFLGLGAWWLFAHVVTPIFSGGIPSLGGHLPGIFWVVAVGMVAGSVVAFRRPVVSVAVLLARIVAVLAWIGLAVYAMTVLV